MKLQRLILAPLLIAIKLYQVTISPLLGPRCRFYPSCSEYASQALQQHALPYALWLSVKRLARCHPGCQGGIDLVPTVSTKSSLREANYVK